ncbi:MAG: GNAT family N-acetyltransferase [Gemmatimonadota bacterium]|nr:GNAT family N-acetyltransferase [Gemmatimonadota bacterium]
MSSIEIHPATPDRWPDLVELFGPRGACGGCWCMEYRRPRAEFDANKGEGNRRALKRRVSSGPSPPGLLAYDEGEPVGWCAVAPREEFRRLETSRILAPVDERPVWSIVCFFVRKDRRHQGISRRLVDGAVDLVARHGGEIVEAYPVEPRKPEMPPVFAFTGLASAFRDAGFEEVERRSETRPIMRRRID